MYNGSLRNGTLQTALCGAVRAHAHARSLHDGALRDGTLRDGTVLALSRAPIRAKALVRGLADALTLMRSCSSAYQRWGSSPCLGRSRFASVATCVQYTRASAQSKRIERARAKSAGISERAERAHEQAHEHVSGSERTKIESAEIESAKSESAEIDLSTQRRA